MTARLSVVPAPMAETTLRERTAHWPVDDLGPAQVVFFRLATGHDAVVVVDNVTLGQAIGGVRMTPTVDAIEVAGLARAMTLKNAVAGLPYGGAKAGLVADPGMEATERERVIRAFAAAIGDLVAYIPGPDIGTDETAMAWIYDEIGRAVGLPAVLGGIPLDQIGATGFGLGVCAGVLQDVGLVHLPDSTVVIQGFGAVGRHAAMALQGRGAKVIAVSDIGGATYNREGLDIDSLVHFKGSSSVGGFPGGRPVPRDDILRLDCDLLVPAAQAGVTTAELLDRAQRGAYASQPRRSPTTGSPPPERTADGFSQTGFKISRNQPLAMSGLGEKDLAIRVVGPWPPGICIGSLKIMKAKVGDWLIVERAHLDEPRRRGQIIELRRPDGAPPYLVRWEDGEEVTLVFPGPDARVVESPAVGGPPGPPGRA